MTELSTKPGRTRRTHSEQFKQALVDECSKPGMSLAHVAKQHGLHPNLLSRWLKDRLAPGARLLPGPRFVPVRIEQALCIEAPQSATLAATSTTASAATLTSKVEINIDRGDLRIRFKVDPSQMTQLGQLLCQVLR